MVQAESLRVWRIGFRSSGLAPPQIPSKSLSSGAYSRQSRRTGQLRHMDLASVPLAYRPGKKYCHGASRQAACCFHFIASLVVSAKLSNFCLIKGISSLLSSVNYFCNSESCSAMIRCCSFLGRIWLLGGVSIDDQL